MFSAELAHLKTHFLLVLTIGAVGGLLHRRFLDLYLHGHACGSFPAPCPSILPDDLGDADHVGRNFEENGEVLDQVIAKKLILRHGRHVEGQDENRGSSDLHWCGPSQKDLQHLVVLVKVVGAQSGVHLRNVLIWRKENRE